MRSRILDRLDVYLNRPSFRGDSLEQIMALRRLLSSDHSVFDLRKIAPPPTHLEDIRARALAVPGWHEFPKEGDVDDVSLLAERSNLDELQQWLNWAQDHWGSATLLYKPAIVAESFKPPQLTYEFATDLGPPYEALAALGKKFPTLKCSWDYWDPVSKSWKWMGFDKGPPVMWHEVLEHHKERHPKVRRIH